MRYWQEIAERLAAAGWTWGCTERVDSNGKTIFVADARNADGKRFAVRSDDKLLAFLELERQISTDSAPALPTPPPIQSTPAVPPTKPGAPKNRPILVIAVFVMIFGLWGIAAYFQYIDRSRQPRTTGIRAVGGPTRAVRFQPPSPSPPDQRTHLSAAELAKRTEEMDRAMEGLIQDSLVKPTRLTSEEKALLDQGHYFEIAGGPHTHSGHMILQLTVGDNKKRMPSVCFFFGMEDIEPGRKEGESMAAFQYTRSQAEQFLFAEGWDKYHDRFFTRYYVQVGMEAYEKELSREGKPSPDKQ